MHAASQGVPKQEIRISSGGGISPQALSICHSILVSQHGNLMVRPNAFLHYCVFLKNNNKNIMFSSLKNVNCIHIHQNITRYFIRMCVFYISHKNKNKQPEKMGH